MRRDARGLAHQLASADRWPGPASRAMNYSFINRMTTADGTGIPCGVGGLTKTELARRAGITAETLTRVERLQRATSASTLSKLATALEIPTPLLMHGKSDPLDMPRCALMSGTPATDPPGT
jgi:hypothetical protein